MLANTENSFFVHDSALKPAHGEAREAKFSVIQAFCAEQTESLAFLCCQPEEGHL
jgi:hypothetical protein